MMTKSMSPCSTHLGNLLADGDEGVAEAVELVLGLGLRGLDHEGSGHGPGHGRGMEAVVDHPLGHVLDLDAALLEAAEVEDELVRVGSVLSL